MFPTSCILAVTLLAASPVFRAAPVEAPAERGSGSAAERPGPASAPQPREAIPEETSEPEAEPSGNEEVDPGEDPASCDGCELA